VDDPGTSRVRILDPFGNLVKSLVKKASSDIFFEWDGRNERGDIVASGGYLCVVDGKRQLYCKIAVIK
jgi:flagellar hook assembly protein FlgD